MQIDPKLYRRDFLIWKLWYGGSYGRIYAEEYDDEIGERENEGFHCEV